MSLGMGFEFQKLAEELLWPWCLVTAIAKTQWVILRFLPCISCFVPDCPHPHHSMRPGVTFGRATSWRISARRCQLPSASTGIGSGALAVPKPGCSSLLVQIGIVFAHHHMKAQVEKVATVELWMWLAGLVKGLACTRP